MCKDTCGTLAVAQGVARHQPWGHTHRGSCGSLAMSQRYAAEGSQGWTRKALEDDMFAGMLTFMNMRSCGRQGGWHSFSALWLFMELLECDVCSFDRVTGMQP